MKNYGIAISFTVLFLSVTVLVLLGNPQFYNVNSDLNKILAVPSLSPATRFKNLDSSCTGMNTQFRYNSARTGLAPNSAQPKAKVAVLKHLQPFNVDIHGASKSSPTIDDSGVYVGSDSGQLIKMDHEGEILWSFYVPGSSNGIHGSPALDEKKVYIGAYDGIMYALDKENGELVWATPVGDYIGASPLLANGFLYIAAETAKPDGLLAKMDCNSGEVIWNSQWLGGHSHSSPTYDETNKAIVLGANSGRIYSFAEDDGHLLWKEQTHGPIKGTPMIWQNAVYFSSWDKNFHGRDLKTGNSLWESFMGGRMQTSLSLIPDYNLGITNTRMGEIVALNLKTGDIQWRLQHGDNDHMSSALITKTFNGKYLVWSRCKDTQLCVLDGKTGTLLHNLELPGGYTSMPFAYGDKVYISLDSDFGFVILQ